MDIIVQRLQSQQANANLIAAARSGHLRHSCNVVLCMAVPNNGAVYKYEIKP